MDTANSLIQILEDKLDETGKKIVELKEEKKEKDEKVLGKKIIASLYFKILLKTIIVILIDAIYYLIASMLLLNQLRDLIIKAFQYNSINKWY